MPIPLITDLRHGLRGLRKAPAFTFIAVSSLALGIGVNVTIFSVAREMILDDLSARQPDRLMTFGTVVSTGQVPGPCACGSFSGAGLQYRPRQLGLGCGRKQRNCLGDDYQR